MKFEWDEAKRNSNIQKHRIDFADLDSFFEEVYFEKKLPFPSEQRWCAIGLLNDKEVTVIFTKRKNKIRIISARRAKKNEREQYRKLYKG